MNKGRWTTAATEGIVTVEKARVRMYRASRKGKD